jgi:hypothetical protein
METKARLGALLLLACIAAAVAGCGKDEHVATPKLRQVADSPSGPVERFAPQFRLHRDEEWLPISTDRFLFYSGLEWIGGFNGAFRCGERDVTASGTIPPGSPAPLPRLDPRRLGHGPRVYRARPYSRDCTGRRRVVYRTNQASGPYDDTFDRPSGLSVVEGFSLDIADEGQYAKHEPASDGSLSGVPVYYARSTHRKARVPVTRISYWALFGREDDGDASTAHEGDWERIDILLQRVPGTRRHRPLALERWTADGKRRRAPWRAVERTPDGHPAIYLELGRHTPSLDGRCGECASWSSWRLLRPLRGEPWWGYRGGWGAVGLTAATSGAAGPAP